MLTRLRLLWIAYAANQAHRARHEAANDAAEVLARFDRQIEAMESRREKLSTQYDGVALFLPLLTNRINRTRHARHAIALRAAETLSKFDAEIHALNKRHDRLRAKRAGRTSEQIVKQIERRARRMA